MIHHTIAGDQICLTYNPPTKTDVTEGDKPVSSTCTLFHIFNHFLIIATQMQLEMLINTTNTIDLFIYIHGRGMTTLDRGGNLEIE